MSERAKDVLRKIIHVTVIVLLIFAAVCIGTFFFKLKIEAHDVLREAKNVKLAFSAVNIELYAQNKSIYDSGKSDGMGEGVESKVREFMKLNENSKFSITAYNGKKRTVTGMIYRRGKYEAVYYTNDSGEHWQVNVIYPVVKFTNSDKEEN